jgi:xylan 1,4-beta-xylosidase
MSVPAGVSTGQALEPDTAAPDTAAPDTAVPDAAVPDTAVPDTAVPDPAVPGTPADAAGGLRARPRRGHIELTWDLVPGAAGYLLERARGTEAFEVVRHGGSDVPAVAGPPFADTGLADGVDYTYRVGAIAGSEYAAMSWAGPVTARTAGLAVRPGELAGRVDITVDAASEAGRLDRVWRMIGSERLTQLRPGDDQDQDQDSARVAAEFAGALRLARTDLGARMVRAHGILHDDNGVVGLDPGGAMRFDFARVDALYDQLLGLGLRPVVELSFMPAALARDPGQTVFTYHGIISPPRDWDEWRRLVTALAAHLIERYGIDEVAEWAFEVWNEPDLEVFWSGSRREYLRLYDESARAIKSVHPRLRVGGPATAAARWIETLAAHAAETGVPLDFVSTHTYGNLPLDARPALRRHGFDGIPIWWTEWGVGATHFGEVHDGVIGAPFILSGLRGAQGRLDALAYWVISDHFTELGRPPRLFHNGFGLLSIGNLRKPRYWAVHLAESLGDELLAVGAEGDGAGTLVQAWAARQEDGTVDVLAWNGTINVALQAGDTRLDRRVAVSVTGLGHGPYVASLARVDERHSNIVARCPADVIWPDEELWARLRAADRLHEEPLGEISAGEGAARFDLDLPMPGVARIRLSPRYRHPGTDSRHGEGER